MDPILNIAVISALNPMWITGFTETEGSFTVSIHKRKSKNNNWHVTTSFELGLHSKDKNIFFLFPRPAGGYAPEGYREK